MEPKFVNDDEVVDRVAQAIYTEQVRQAVAAIEQLAFSSNAMVDLFRKMAGESFTARVVLLGSYLEQMSIDLLKLHLRVPKSRAEYERIFGPNGPLGSFSARIDIAHSLQWIPDRVRDHLHAFRKLRNLFAHEAYKIDISDSAVVDLLRNIQVDVEATIRRVNQALEEEQKIVEPLTEQQVVLVKLLFVAGEMIESLLAGPIIQAFRVDARSVLGDWHHAPEAVLNVRRNMARSMLYMLRGKL
jgi:hypothetical protein